MKEHGEKRISGQPSGPEEKRAPFIRSMNENDAERLSRCVKDCYGDTYPVKDFYDPDKIRSLVRQGLMHSQIAVTGEGEVVGHLGIVLDGRDDITADAVAGFVSPDYRGSDTMFRLGLSLGVVQQKLNLVGVQLYALMLHSITHKKAIAVGGVESGMLPAHFPASTSPRGFERRGGGGRIPAMMIYVPLGSAPERTVYIPERYQDVISGLYGRLKYTRSIKNPVKSRAKQSAAVTVSSKSGMGTVQIKVKQTGQNLLDKIEDLKEQFRKDGTGVVYVDLPLCDSASAAAAESLRSAGFFYGGVVIERGGGDSLRMQYLMDDGIAPDNDLIVSQSGRDLLSFVMDDARDVGAVC